MPSLEKNNKPKKQRYRRLFESEIALAKTVYQDTLPYKRIFISNFKTTVQGITLATRRNSRKANYIILWSDIFSVDATTEHYLRSTFIHELAHVWQSQYGKSAVAYMRESAWKQLKHGVKDIFSENYLSGFKRVGEMTKKGFAEEWGYHRNMAYQFEMSEIGKDFKEFNVEQQAMIIETWFRSEPYKTRNAIYPAGFASEQDSRFPYVRDCIRAGNPNAKYQKLLEA